MATNRAPRNAKPLIAKVMALIEEFPDQSQIEVCQWLSGQIRTEILPELRAQMKAAAKEEAGTARGRRTTRGTSARGGTRGESTAKRSAAAKKAAATRKARGTQRGGRRPRNATQAPEIHAESQTANTAAA